MAKIIGGTTSTPMRVPDWNQTDPTKADYIKNKPDLSSLVESKQWTRVVAKTIEQEYDDDGNPISVTKFEFSGLSGYTEFCATGEIVMSSNKATLGTDGKYTGYTANKNITFTVGRTVNLSARQAVKVNHGTTYYFTAQGRIGHGGTVIYYFGIGTDRYSLPLVRGHCALPSIPNTQINSFRIYIPTSEAEYSFGVGSNIELWGR